MEQNPQYLFNSISEFFSLIALRFSVAWFNTKEDLKVVWRYYRNLKFAHADLLLLMLYLFRNPFRMARRFLIKQGSVDSFSYGETPLTTFGEIIKAAELSPSDKVVELGCGRGRTLFWLKAFVGCEVVGIECVPGFVTRAQKVVKWCGWKGIDFRCENMFTADLSEATVVYLYGTSLSDREIERLITLMKRLPSGAKVITVSYPLTDYIRDRNPFLVPTHTLDGAFPWGTTDIYIHRRQA
jgi:SAM-dependent methyltransferase